MTGDRTAGQRVREKPAVVDDRGAHDKVLGYVQTLVPALSDRMRLYGDRRPVFDAFGIEKEIEKALPAGTLTAAERWLLYYSLRAAQVEIIDEVTGQVDHGFMSEQPATPAEH